MDTTFCTAIARQSLWNHCIIMFAYPPSPVYTSSYIFTPGLYRIDMGVFLTLWLRA